MSSRLFASKSRRPSAFSLMPMLDELEHRGKLVDRVRHDAFLHIRRNDDEWNARTKPELIRIGRLDVVVKSAEIIPGQHDRGGRPRRPAHDRVDLLDGPVLPFASGDVMVVPANACTVGCSLTSKSGISQLTAGSVPLAASPAKRSNPTTRVLPQRTHPDVPNGIEGGPDVAVLATARRVVLATTRPRASRLSAMRWEVEARGKTTSPSPRDRPLARWCDRRHHTPR